MLVSVSGGGIHWSGQGPLVWGGTFYWWFEYLGLLCYLRSVASVRGIFILVGGLGTRLSLYGVFILWHFPNIS